MANFIYTEAFEEILKGEIDWADDTIKVALVGAASTCDTEEDVEFLDDFDTLDEMTDADYARQTIASMVVTKVGGSDRAYADGSDVTFETTAAGDDVAGILVYKHVTNDADSIPLIWFDDFTAFTPAGMDVRVVWSASGIIQLQNA